MASVSGSNAPALAPAPAPTPAPTAPAPAPIAAAPQAPQPAAPGFIQKRVNANPGGIFAKGQEVAGKVQAGIQSAAKAITPPAIGAAKAVGGAVVNSANKVAGAVQQFGRQKAAQGDGMFRKILGNPTPPKIAGKRAEGGPVTAGQPYLVGEKGPEVVVPKPSATSQAIMGVVHAGGNLAKGAAGLVSMAAEAKLKEADDFDTGKTKPSNFVPISERYKDEPWYKQIPKQLRDSLLLSPSDPQVIQQFKHTTGGWASAAREPIQAIKQRADKEHVAATNTQTALEPQLGNVGQATSFAASLTPGARALDIPASIGAAKSLKGGIVPAIATAVTRKLPGGELAKNSAQQAIGAIVGARAEGGPVTAGQPYLVGEKGPEVVVPQSSGTVIPNHKLPDLTPKPTHMNAASNLGMPAGTPSTPSRPLSSTRNWRMPTSARTTATWKPQPPRLLAIN